MTITEKMVEIPELEYERLKIARHEITAMNDYLKKMMVAFIVVLLILVGACSYTIAATQTAQQSILINRQVGLGNRHLLCVATSAPGNDLPPTLIPQKLCQQDFSGER